MTSVTQLGYLGLSVSNVDEWERFATQILGLQAMAAMPTVRCSCVWTRTTIVSSCIDRQGGCRLPRLGSTN